MTLLFGVFSSYLGSSQVIIDDVFGLGARFPLIFSGMALLMGVAALGNASVVERFGARRIVRTVLTGYVVVAGGTGRRGAGEPRPARLLAVHDPAGAVAVLQRPARLPT